MSFYNFTKKIDIQSSKLGYTKLQNKELITKQLWNPRTCGYGGNLWFWPSAKSWNSTNSIKPAPILFDSHDNDTSPLKLDTNCLKLDWGTLVTNKTGRGSMAGSILWFSVHSNTNLGMDK